MFHPFRAVLVVLLAATACLGPLHNVLLMILVVLHHPREAERPFVISLATGGCVLQSIAIIAVNIVAASDSSLATRLFTDNRVVVNGFGIQRATMGNIWPFLGATVPMVLLLSFCVASRKRLTKPFAVRHSDSVLASSTWAVLLVATGCINATLVSAPFLLLGLVAVFLVSISAAAGIQRAASIGGVIVPIITGILLCFQNNFVSEPTNTIEVAFGLLCYDRDDNVQSVLQYTQLFLAVLASLVTQSMKEFRNPTVSPMTAPLISQKSSLHSAGVGQGDLSETRESRAQSSAGGFGLDLLAQLQQRAEALVRGLLYYLLFIPSVPLLGVAAAIIVFPSAPTLALFPFLLVALLSHPRHFPYVLGTLLPVYAAGLIGQFAVLAVERSWSLGMGGAAMFRYSDENVRTVELCSNAAMFLLLGASRFVHHQASRQEGSGVLATLALSIASPLAQPWSAEDLAVLNDDRINAIKSLTVTRRDPATGDTCTDVDATFIMLVDRRPTGEEREALHDRDLSHDVLLRSAQLAAGSRMLQARKYLAAFLKGITAPVALLSSFVAGTCVHQLDVLHCLLLSIFLAFLCSPAIAKRHWGVLVVFTGLMTAMLSTITLVDRFHPLPTYVTGERDGHVRLTTLGLRPWLSEWEAAACYASLFLVAAERHLLRRSYKTWRGPFMQHQWRRLLESAVCRTWRRRLTITLAAVVFISLGIFEEKSLLVLGFLLLFLVVCIAEAYYASVRVMVFLWRVATVYAIAVMLAMSAYQFADVRTSFDRWIESFSVCESLTDPLLCQRQLGVVIPEKSILTLYLAPWFVALVTSFFQLKIQLEILAARQLARAVHLGASGACEESPPFNGADERFLLLLHTGMIKAEAVALRGTVIAAHHATKIVWVALYIAATSTYTAITLMYAIFLLSNLSGKISLLYSVLHLAVIYAYQFSFVPQITDRVNGVNVSEVIGLIKSSDDTAAASVVGPTLVFFATLFYESTKGIISRANSSPTTSMNPHDESLSWWQFVRHYGVPACGYELYALVVLVTMALTYDTILGVAVFTTVVTLLWGGRWRFLQSWPQRAVAFAQLSALLLYELIIQVNKQHDIVGSTEDARWKYWGIEGHRGAMFSMFIGVCVAHIIAAHRDDTERLFESIRGAKDGHATLMEYLRARDPGDAGRKNRDVIFTALPPATSMIPVSSRYVSSVEPLVRFFATFSPVAFFSFAAGIARPSLIHLALMVGGVIQFTFVEDIVWRFHRLWPHLQRGYMVLLVLPIIFYVPPIADWVRDHSGLMSVLGLYNTFTSQVVTFSAIRAALLWVCVLQRRVYEEFSFAEVLRDAKSSEEKRNERHVELLAIFEELEAADHEVARHRDEVLRKKLEEIRSTSNLIEAATYQVEESETSRSSEKSAHTGETVSSDERSLGSQGKIQASSEDEKAVQEKPPLKERLLALMAKVREAVGSRAEMLIALLVALSYRRETPDAQLPYFRRLWTSLLAFLQRSTPYVVVIASVLNFASSGTVWDMLPSFVLLTVTLFVHPWAPLVVYNGVAVYVLSGIVLKCAIMMLVSQIKVSRGAADFFSTFFTPFADRSNPLPGGSSTYSFNQNMDLLADFFLFALLVVHRKLSLAAGVYAATSESPMEDEARLEPESWKVKLRGVVENITRTQGTGVDLYLTYTVVECVALLVLIFNYYTMTGTKTGSIIASVQANLLPGAFVLLFFLSLLCLMLDRMCYVTSNMLAKWVMNVTLSIGFHVAYVWWSQHVPQQPTAGAVYLVFKAIYIGLSCEQIKYGFTRHRRHDPFTHNPSSVLLFVGYTVYRAIPFLWELRTVVDWTVTKTTLRLDSWLVVEDVFDIMYNRRLGIDERRTYQKAPGTPAPLALKLSQGLVRVLLMFLAIVLPLAIYSSFNPNMEANSVKQLSTEFTFGSSTTLMSSPQEEIQTYGGPIPAWIGRTRPSVRRNDIGGDHRGVALVSTTSCSSDVWTISPQGRRLLLANLNQTLEGLADVEIAIAIHFTRTAATEGAPLSQVLFRTYTVPLDAVRNINDAIALNESSGPIMLPRFYDPFVFNQPTKVETLSQMTGDEQNLIDCSIQLRSEFDVELGTNVRYWCMKCDSLFSRGNFPNATFPEYRCLNGDASCTRFNFEKHPHPYNPVPMYFVVVSDRVAGSLGFIPNLGIVAIYTTFVLALGRVLRGMFSDSARQVIIGMVADPTPVEQLLDFISVARACDDMKLEEALYFELVDLLRSPEKLLKVTGFTKDTFRSPPALAAAHSIAIAVEEEVAVNPEAS